DRVAEHTTRRGHREHELRLRDGPRRVLSDHDGFTGAHHARPGRLEKQLRALGRINAVVEAAAARVLRFAHTGRPAAELRNACRPSVLALSRGSRGGELSVWILPAGARD